MARSRLNPAAGAILSALWVSDSDQLVLVIHHLAIDAVSWWILLEDLNIAWAQHHAGHEVLLPATGTSYARWSELLAQHAVSPHVVEAAEAWKHVAEATTALPAVNPAVDTYATAGHLSVVLDAQTTHVLLGEVPAAFHAGIQDILLIAFALAWAEFLGFWGTGGTPIGIDVEGHGRHEELAPDVDLTRTVGWFTAIYPVALAVGGLFCLILLYHNISFLIAPSMLIFYGLALLNASKYTLKEIRYLGMIEICLGLFASTWIQFGIVLWGIGFGMLHIVYGTFMYFKYEK